MRPDEAGYRLQRPAWYTLWLGAPIVSAAHGTYDRWGKNNWPIVTLGIPIVLLLLRIWMHFRETRSLPLQDRRVNSLVRRYRFYDSAAMAFLAVLEGLVFWCAQSMSAVGFVVVLAALYPPYVLLSVQGRRSYESAQLLGLFHEWANDLERSKTVE